MEYNLKDILSEIEKRRDLLMLSEQEDIDQSRIDYLNDFFENYNGKRITSIAYMKPSEIILAYLLEQYPNISFEELYKEVIDIECYINSLNIEDFDNTHMLSLNIPDYLLEKVINLKNEDGVIYKSINYLTLKKEFIKVIENNGINNFIDSQNNLFALACLIKIIKKISKKEYIDFIRFIISLKYSQQISNLLAFSLNIGSDEDSYVEFMLKKTADRKKVEKSMDSVYRYYLSLEKKQNQAIKEKNKKLNQYTSLMELLKKENEKKEIKCIDNILDIISDDDLKVLCLKYIYNHNKVYYEELEKEYIYKNENSISKYISYFKELGIDFISLKEEEQKEIMQESLDMIKEKIKLLSKVFADKRDCLSLVEKQKYQLLKN